MTMKSKLEIIRRCVEFVYEQSGTLDVPQELGEIFEDLVPVNPEEITTYLRDNYREEQEVDMYQLEIEVRNKKVEDILLDILQRFK